MGFLLDQPLDFKVLLIVESETRHSYSTNKKSAISSRYKSSCSSRSSNTPSSMYGVIDRRRPPRLRGAVVFPKTRVLARWASIVRVLQGMAFAICRVLSRLSASIARLRACCETARFGAIALVLRPGSLYGIMLVTTYKIYQRLSSNMMSKKVNPSSAFCGASRRPEAPANSQSKFGQDIISSGLALFQFLQ